MPRTLSNAALRALLTREAGDGVVVLATLTIGTGGGATTLRFVNNVEDITSGANTFTAYPFKVALSTDGEESPRITLQIANTNAAIMRALIDQRDPPAIQFDVILLSAPDTVLVSFAGFKVIDVSADAMVIEGTLTMDRTSTEPWPKIRATRDRCPSLVA